jgi:hypothetical protein
MPKKYSTYWYQEGPEFKQAFLYNLRDNDVQSGGMIEQGAIVLGAVGLVAAESTVVGRTGKILPFSANRRCEWQGFELPCMTLPTLPAGKVPASSLRDGNYAVAAITSDEVKAKADSLKVPSVRTPQGVWVINVELARFNGQGSGRRATLI